MMFPANVLQKIFKRFPLDGDGICVACNIQMRHKNAESFAARTGRKWVESLTAKAKRKRKLSLRLTATAPATLLLFRFSHFICRCKHLATLSAANFVRLFTRFSLTSRPFFPCSLQLSSAFSCSHLLPAFFLATVFCPVGFLFSATAAAAAVQMFA